MSTLQSPSSRRLKSLAPSENAEQSDVYKNALAFAIEDSSIMNVALTGPYGSGKSSILKTFAKKSNYKCIEISLATFKEFPTKKKNNENNVETPDAHQGEQKKSNSATQTDEQQRLVELSILQQLFYQVNPETIPLSGFKRITKIDEGKVTENLLITISAILGILFFARPPFIKIPTYWKLLIIHHENGLFFPATFLILIALVPLIKWSFRTLQVGKLSAKIKVSNAEFGIDKEAGISILNKHIDEILYIFECNEIDVVLIEDLDRFNNPEIFTNLREINSLINGSLIGKYGKKKRKVTFVYALRDDMFLDTKRTKFFDLIIPVIPIIDYSNSYEIAHKENEHIKISDHLLSDITLYINDLRLLNNIFNEYYIYSDALYLTGKNDKLFAMVVYKNCYPEDFANLHEQKGLVYDAFKKDKDNIIQQLISANLSSKRLKQQEIDNIDAEKLTDIEELTSLYLRKIQKKIPEAMKLRIGTDEKKFAELNSEDLIKISESKMELKYITLHNSYADYYTFNPVQSGITFNEIEKEINSKYSFSERASLIERKHDGTLNNLKAQIEILEREIAAIQTSSLCNLLENEFAKSFLDPKLQEKELLVYLLRIGYIDEMYPVVISYFYPNSITQAEREYLLNVKDRMSTPFEKPLINMYQVVKRLDHGDFSVEAIFNYDLLNYLINSGEHVEKCQQIIGLISKKSKNSLSFLDGYLESKNSKEKFIALITKYWPQAWKYIQKESNYTLEKSHAWLRQMILHAETTDIKQQNTNSVLSDYISELPNFIGMFNSADDSMKVCAVLEALNVKFKAIDPVYITSTQFDFVYKNELYELNNSMISLLIKTRATAQLNDIEIEEANYTAILKSGCAELNSYISENLSDYVHGAFLKTDQKRKEDEKTIISLLEEDQLSEDEKLQIIRKADTKITDINNVKSDFWDELFINNNVLPIWENVLDYFDNANMDIEHLANFINLPDVFSQLKDKIIPGDAAESENLEFCKWLIESDLVSDRCFSAIATCVPYTFADEVDFKGISVNKIDNLLSNGKLEFSVHNFDQIKLHSSPQQITLIEHSPQKFLENIKALNCDSSDFINILNSAVLGAEYKESIIDKIPVLHILKSEELSNLLFKIIQSQKSISLKFDCISAINANLKLPREKIQLLNLVISNLSTDETYSMLATAGEPYNQIFRNSTARPKFEKTDLNIKMAETLKARGLVSRVSDLDKYIRLYLKQPK